MLFLVCLFIAKIVSDLEPKVIGVQYNFNTIFYFSNIDLFSVTFVQVFPVGKSSPYSVGFKFGNCGVSQYLFLCCVLT